MTRVFTFSSTAKNAGKTCFVEFRSGEFEPADTNQNMLVALYAMVRMRTAATEKCR